VPQGGALKKHQGKLASISFKESGFSLWRIGHLFILFWFTYDTARIECGKQEMEKNKKPVQRPLLL
jgi:hypothetical protein